MKGHIETRSLCDRCDNGTVSETEDGRRTVYCAIMNREVFPNIKSCNRYTPIGQPAFKRWISEDGLNAFYLLDTRDAPPSTEKGYV